MILVDGSSCLHRCLNTPLAEATDSSGRSVGGVSGFLASIGSTVNKLRQQHLIIVAWDVGIPVHRQQLFPSYKSHNRSIAGLGIPGNFERQLLSRNGDKLPTNFREKYLIARRILSMNLLPFMGCLSIQVPNCEADDIIAYICDKITSNFSIPTGASRTFAATAVRH
jgi:5'-3' exonuclease